MPHPVTSMSNEPLSDLNANPKNLPGLALEVVQGRRNDNIDSVERDSSPCALGGLFPGILSSRMH